LPFFFVIFGWVGLMAQKGDFGFGDSMVGTLKFLVPVAIVAAGVYVVWKNSSKTRT